MAKKAKKTLAEALGIDEASAMIFYSHAFRSPEEIAAATVEELMQIPGMSAARVQELKDASKAYIEKKRMNPEGTGEAPGMLPPPAEGDVPLENVKGVGPKTLELLAAAGITAPSQVAH
jgi:predicted flap endonuclease-1-like 5' DNA nuclease